MVERTHKVLIIRQTPSSQVMACSLRFLDVFLNSGKGVTFKASNGKYFSSTGNGPRNPILASHTHPDNTCYFQLSRTNAGKIVLQDYCKLYLSRIHENGVDRIEAAKRNPDICCEFHIYPQGGAVALQADNGNYLSLVCRGSVDAIEAAKTSVDGQCLFQVHEQGSLLLGTDSMALGTSSLGFETHSMGMCTPPSLPSPCTSMTYTISSTESTLPSMASAGSTFICTSPRNTAASSSSYHSSSHYEYSSSSRHF
ncbi:uncharacterized protein LOC135358776 isoform X1 [Latimeria chalumnae]|uniref:uncharacterized protein LOC135357798 isoform X1 n=1 Tax=Latimeria chalumnae TaxID=7897 RepID=UPI00313A86AE